MNDELAKKDQQIRLLQSEISELRAQINTDELTQILNRRGLMAYLAAISREVSFQLKNPGKRRSVVIKALSIIMIDIDHFKEINDNYGHQAGDVVLQGVAAVIDDFVRGIDVVGRYGGEEIMVGLVGAESKDAQRIAEDLRAKIEQHEFSHDQRKIKLTASFGVATLSPSQKLNELIAEADSALYEAKNSGRNRVVVADNKNEVKNDTN